MSDTSLIVGNGSAAADLVGEGLVDPLTIQDADCEHGFESASFVIEGQMPHVRAHNALVEHAPVKIYRAGAVTFEGAICSIDDTGETHEVECAGIYDELKRREDYAQGFVESRTELIRKWPLNLWFDTFKDVDYESVLTEGQFQLNIALGTTYKDGQAVLYGIWICDGLNDNLEIKRITADFVEDTDSWDFTIGVAASPFDIDQVGATGELEYWGGGRNDTHLDYDFAAIGAGRRFIYFASASGANAVASQDEFHQFRNLHIYVDRITAPRPDQIIAEIAMPADNSICLASATEVLGSVTTQFMADPFTTRAETIEQARALYSGIMDVGVWDDATVHIRARPTAPDNRQRHYAIRAANLVNPDDWQIARDSEAGVDAICGVYELVPVDDVQVPTPPSAVWPASWTRSDANCFSFDPGTGFRYYVRSNHAVSHNPSCYPTDLRPCAPNELYPVRARAAVDAYPGDGYAAVTIYWYTAADAYISATVLKSFMAATTEAWYEKTMQAPPTAYQYRPVLSWGGVTLDGTDHDLTVRDIWFGPAMPAGTLKTVYYPSKPSAQDARVPLLEIGPATDAEALAAVTQVYIYTSQLATGSCPLVGTVETIDGAPADVRHIRSWDWVSKVEAFDAEDRGPFMLSRVERNPDGSVNIEVGGDYWQHPGFAHAVKMGRYVGARRVRRAYYVRQKVKGKMRRVKKYKWVDVEGHYQ
jgi:hypothetical protein